MWTGRGCTNERCTVRNECQLRLVSWPVKSAADQFCAQFKMWMCIGMQVHRTPREDWSTCGREWSSRRSGVITLWLGLSKYKAKEGNGELCWPKGDTEKGPNAKGKGGRGGCRPWIRRDKKARESKKLTLSMVRFFKQYTVQLTVDKTGWQGPKKCSFFTAQGKPQEKLDFCN